MSLQVLVCPECKGLGKVMQMPTVRLSAAESPEINCGFCDGRRFVAVSPNGLRIVNPKQLPEEMNRIIDRLPPTAGPMFPSEEKHG